MHCLVFKPMVSLRKYMYIRSSASNWLFWGAIKSPHGVHPQSTLTICREINVKSWWPTTIVLIWPWSILIVTRLSIGVWNRRNLLILSHWSDLNNRCGRKDCEYSDPAKPWTCSLWNPSKSMIALWSGSFLMLLMRIYVARIYESIWVLSLRVRCSGPFWVWFFRVCMWDDLHGVSKLLWRDCIPLHLLQIL